MRNEITIYGSIIYTVKDFADAIGYLNDPKFNIGSILSKILPVSQFQEALMMLFLVNM